jgi:hypothetical protein
MATYHVMRNKIPRWYMDKGNTPLSSADVPVGCSDPKTGQDYWAWIADPSTVKDSDERIRLIRHTATCAVCLERLFEWLRLHPPMER